MSWLRWYSSWCSITRITICKNSFRLLFLTYWVLVSYGIAYSISKIKVQQIKTLFLIIASGLLRYCACFIIKCFNSHALNGSTPKGSDSPVAAKLQRFDLSGKALYKTKLLLLWSNDQLLFGVDYQLRWFIFAWL